jgi:ABC-type Fe3+-hydroxamate transport system substrate-binding protein
VNDDLGAAVPRAGPPPPRRVVSLVPSLTEAVAATVPELLVGATDYCTHPADLRVARVGGTKYADPARVLDLAPDLVLANAEENRREDVEALRAAGIAVWVTFPRTLDEAFTSLRRMLGVLGQESDPSWLVAAEAAWATPPPRSSIRVAVPIWRRPWIVLGGQTFAGDLLARLGLSNVYGDATERYPRPTLDEIRATAPDLVVLPDEPYAFTAADGPEAFGDLRCALVSGRHLTWYGPSLVQARRVLTEQLGVDLPLIDP